MASVAASTPTVERVVVLAPQPVEISIYILILDGCVFIIVPAESLECGKEIVSYD